MLQARNCRRFARVAFLLACLALTVMFVSSAWWMAAPGLTLLASSGLFGAAATQKAQR